MSCLSCSLLPALPAWALADLLEGEELMRKILTDTEFDYELRRRAIWLLEGPYPHIFQNQIPKESFRSGENLILVVIRKSQGE